MLWELAGTGEDRQRRALRIIGAAFVLLAVYLSTQSTWSLLAGFHPRHSPFGIAWTGATAAVMFVLATGKAHTGHALANPVLVSEGRVTFIDGVLTVAVLAGLGLNAAFGAWWADPLAGFVIVFSACAKRSRSSAPSWWLGDRPTGRVRHPVGYRHRSGEAASPAAHSSYRASPPRRGLKLNAPPADPMIYERF